MSIRKINADYLFTGTELLYSDKVLITDEKGTIKGISQLADAGDGVVRHQGVITPGFINTHCHIELSHMKGRIPEGTGLIEFLNHVIKERYFPEEQVTTAMQEAENEMYLAGIEAVGDICNTADSLKIKKNNRLSWYNFIEVMGFNQQDAPARIAYANKLLNQFQASLSSSQLLALAPHAPYSVSENLFKLINENSAGSVITIHNQESDAENDLYQNKTGRLFELYRALNIDTGSFKPTGKTSLQSCLPWLNKAKSVILAHNVNTSEEDVLFVMDDPDLYPSVYFCVCINANRYIQSVNPPIDLLRKYSCNITLGTDSYASNWQLSILEEMKTIHQEFPSVPLAEILKWATSNGANALGMDERLGSFNAGKKPGIVLINNINEQHLTGHSTATRLL